MSFLSRIFGGKPKEAESQKQYGIPLNQAMRFLGGQLIPYDNKQLTFVEKGYKYNDMVYSVIKMIADKAVIPPPGIYRIKDEYKFRQYTKLVGKMERNEITPQEWVSLKDLRHKSIELYQDDEYLNELIKWPNENECFQDRDYAHYTMKLITGNAYEAGWAPLTGGLNKGKPMQLYGLPSQYMAIEAERGAMPLTAKAYLLQQGQNIRFEKEDVLHEKYFSPDWDTYGIQLYGMSPMEAGLQRLQSSNEGVLRQAKMMANAGADVIAYMDDDLARSVPGFSNEQIGMMKERWVAEQGGPLNAGRAIFSPYKMGVARMGLSAVDMQLLELHGVDRREICNWYGAPSQLQNDPANKTYNNSAEGEKALILRCAMPLNISRQRNFNRKLQQSPAYRKSNVLFEYDFTAYTELEQNKKDLLDWATRAYLPVERVHELVGEDTPEYFTEEQRRMVFVPSGFQLLDDFSADGGTESIQGDINVLRQTGDDPYQEDLDNN